MTRCWIAVASADHARRACAVPDAGFMQVCHGKRAPLQRMSPGDLVACYAPKLAFGGREPCQKFVSLGVVQSGEPRAFDQGAGLMPFRRGVHYLPSREAAIHPLLDALEFVDDRARWGAKFRFGLFEVSARDMGVIAAAMDVALDIDIDIAVDAGVGPVCALPGWQVTLPLF